MYIEVFLIDNLIMDMLILRLAAALLSRRIAGKRLILFSLIGTGFSLLAALWPGVFASASVKLIEGFFLSFALPDIVGRKRLLAFIAVLFSASTVGGAAVMTAFMFGDPRGGISLLCALLCIAAASLLPRGIRRLMARRVPDDMAAEVFAELSGGVIINCAALVDTGNRLVEPASALPVIVLSAKKYPRLAFAADRPVPMLTAGGRSVIYALKPRSVRVNGVPVDALIAFSSADTALVPVCLMAAACAAPQKPKTRKGGIEYAETYKETDREAV